MAQARDEGRDLDRRQLPTLAGLGTLRHLDLDLLRAHQILSRDTKATGGHLLDLAADLVAIHRLMIPVRVFATLAGIIATTDAVHGCRDGFVRLRAERAERHGCDHETLTNRLHRLYLVQRHRGGALEAEQITHRRGRTLIDQRGELLIVLFTTRAGRLF